MWNCELKTRLSDIVSHLRSNYRQILTQQHATTRKQENPVNTAQKMAIQSSTKQNEEATTEEVPGSIVPYTKEEINTFKEDMAPENTKKSTPLAIVLNRDT